MRRLLLKLLGRVKEDTVHLNVGELSLQPAPKLTVSNFKHLIEFLCELGEYGIALQFTRSNYGARPASAISSNTVFKDEAITCMKDLKQRYENLAGPSLDKASEASLFQGLRFGTKDIREWLDATQEMQQKLVRQLFDELAEQINSKADSLDKVYPRHERLVNDTIWLKTQCKQQLLTKTDHHALSQNAVALHLAIFKAKKASESLMGTDTNFAEAYDKIASASIVYSSAKAVIILIKHLHVCQVLTGDDQLKEADALHVKQQSVPKPVREHIAILASRYESSQKTSGPSAKKLKKA